MKIFDTIIPIALILTCVGIGALVYKQYVPADASFGGSGLVSQRSCTSSSTSKTIGPSTSNGSAVALESNSNRAWARIQVPHGSGSTFTLAFDEGVNAVVGSGIVLNGGTQSGAGTSTDLFIDFGRNTDFPYTGIVTGIASGAASTSLNVTECSFF